MDQEGRAELDRLPYTPSFARSAPAAFCLPTPDVDDTDYKRILEIFRSTTCAYFCYNGGNDSPWTLATRSRSMKKVGYECRVMGVPKTIDNDLFGTDHCPELCLGCKIYPRPPSWKLPATRACINVGQITVISAWVVTPAG